MILRVTLEGRTRRELKTVRAGHIRVIKLKQSGILQQVFDALFLVFYHDVIFLFMRFNLHFVVLFALKVMIFNHIFLDLTAAEGLTILEDGGRIARVSLFGVIRHDDDLFFLMSFHIGCLNGVVSALLVLTFINFADTVYFLNQIVIDGHSLFRILLFLFQHAQIEHFILNLCIQNQIPRQVAETSSSQLGFSLNCSSQASTTL